MGAVGPYKILLREFVLKPLQYFGNSYWVTFVGAVNAAVVAAGLYADDMLCIFDDGTTYNRYGNYLMIL